MFLLASLDKNASLRDSLKNFLGFYKENRELISSIVNAPSPAPNPAPQQKESPPANRQADSLDLVERYLSRCAV